MRWSRRTAARADFFSNEAAVSQRDVYTLAISRGYVVFAVAILIALTCAGVVLLFLSLRGGSDELPLPFPVLLCAAMAWNWHVLLGIPYEIRFENARRMSFVSLRKTTTLSAEELQSLKLTFAGGFYVLRHDGGKIHLHPRFTGFHEVISRIKAANPKFETVGI
jgi:hypothetical protein